MASSSDSSSSDSSRGAKRQKKERKREKKEKKHKKHKKSKKHKHERAASYAAGSCGSAPATLLSESDYFLRSAEFQLWLQESEGRFFDELPSADARKYFKRFVESWNKGALPPKMYAGGSDILGAQSASRTRHKWAFASKLSEAEQLQLDSTRDRVGSQTQKPTMLTDGRPGRAASAAARAVPGAGWARAVSGAVAGPALCPPVGSTVGPAVGPAVGPRLPGGVANRREADAAMAAELAPRADPGSREAKLEKRSAQTAFHRAKEDGYDGLAMPDKDLMGGASDEYQRRVAQRQGQRNQRQAVASERVAELQAKEQARMDEFKKRMGLS